MLQEEFSRLIYMYQLAAEGKSGSVHELFQKSLEFIEHLKQELVKGDEEEKEAAIRMMRELYECMKAHTQLMCKQAGISEEQLIANSENPSNFTPEQWRNMQESKERLANAGKELVKIYQTQKTLEKALPNPESLMSKPSPEKKEKKGKKTKKSDWMRS